MQRHNPTLLRVGGLLATLALCAAAGEALAAPLPLATSRSVQNGNWYPLPVEDMKAAASDAALAELSEPGALAFVSAEGAKSGGSLALDLSLIGKAETAKLTLRLDVDGGASHVATASISLRDLDYQEIHRALEHVGHEAGRRMNAKLEGHPLRGPAPVAEPTDDHPELQRLYDSAQRAKHLDDYHGARVIFEEMVRRAGPGAERFRDLAEDELRYGLPLFEARRGLMAVGGRVNAFADQRQAMLHAENLFRQIQAENPKNGARVQEAQRALDDLAISRMALDNAIKHTALARVMNLRMMLMEQLMMEGRCPDDRFVEQMLEQLSVPLSLTESEATAERARRYVVLDATSDLEVVLLCDRDVKIEHGSPRVPVRQVPAKAGSAR